MNRGETLVLLRLGAAEFIAGAPESTLAWAEQALPIYERLDDTLGSPAPWHYIAEALRDLGDFERSAELFARSIEIRRANGLGSGAATVHSLGDLYLDTGDMPTAERYYREALALGQQEGDVRLGVVLPRGSRLRRRAKRGRNCGRPPVDSRRAARARDRLPDGRGRASPLRAEPDPPPLTNTDEYRAGIADAANIDPLTAAAEDRQPVVRPDAVEKQVDRAGTATNLAAMPARTTNAGLDWKDVAGLANRQSRDGAVELCLRNDVVLHAVLRALLI